MSGPRTSSRRELARRAILPIALLLVATGLACRAETATDQQRDARRPDPAPVDKPAVPERPDPAPAEPAPVPVATPDVPAATSDANDERGALAGPLRVGWDEPDPASIEDTQDLEDEPSMMDHPVELGWTSDSAGFGYCQPSGGADCDDCRIVWTDGRPDARWGRGSDCERDERSTVAAEWKRRGIGVTPRRETWSYGHEVALAWDLVPGVEPEPGVAARPARLRLGAQIKGEAPVYFATFTEPELAEMLANYDLFPESTRLSPDGVWIAIMTHGFAGEFSDTIRVRFQRADELAFNAYHRTGLALLRTKPARAAELFATAAAIQPDAWKAHHNLACALALAGRPDEAREPLRRAIAAGGDKARDKARADADLAAARERPWFTELVPP